MRAKTLNESNFRELYLKTQHEARLDGRFNTFRFVYQQFDEFCQPSYELAVVKFQDILTRLADRLQVVITLDPSNLGEPEL